MPAQKRKVVEEAASNLGLSTEELREKLLIVANMQVSANEAPSQDRLVEEVDEDVKIEALLYAEYVSKGDVLLSVEKAGASGAGPSAHGGSAG